MSKYKVNIKNSEFIFTSLEDKSIQMKDIVEDIVYARYGEDNIKGSVKWKYKNDGYSCYYHLRFKVKTGQIADFHLETFMRGYSGMTIDSFNKQLDAIDKVLDSFDRRLDVESKTHIIEIFPKKLQINVIPEFQIDIMNEYDRKYDNMDERYERLRGAWVDLTAKYDTLVESINNGTKITEDIKPKEII